MARTFRYEKPGRKKGNLSPSFCMSEAHRLLHDMSPYREVGRAFGKRYKLLTFYHSVCQRPGCTAEIYIGRNMGAGNSSAPELRKGSAIYSICIGEGAPDGTGIVIGRMFTDDTRKHLSEYGKSIAAKGGSFDPLNPTYEGIPNPADYKNPSSSPSSSPNYSSGPVAAYDPETSLKGGDKQEPEETIVNLDPNL